MIDRLAMMIVINRMIYNIVIDVFNRKYYLYDIVIMLMVMLIILY
jgi:hypothetical protein